MMTIPAIQTRRFGELKLGKSPSKGAFAHCKMADLMPYVQGVPNPPQSWGWGYDFGRYGWGMDGNGPASPSSDIPPGWAAYEGCGDCFWAMLAHKIRENAKNARRPIPPISDLTVINQYAAYSGYNPQTGENDNGTDPAGAYQYLQQQPFYDDNNVTYPFEIVIDLTPGDVKELWSAIWIFESVGVGVQLQEAQEEQFNNMTSWTYVAGSPIVGGHEVLVNGPDGLISWGVRVPWDVSFIQELNDESQATLSLDIYNQVTGETVNHFTQADMEKFVVLFQRARGIK